MIRTTALASLASRVAGGPRLLRDRRDAALVLVALLLPGAVVLVPLAPVVAVGVWWGSNTVSHYFIHRPFFRGRALNASFDLYLSAVLGIPQSIWRVRHLAHHAGVAPRHRWSVLLGGELAMVATVWALLAALAPLFLLTAYLPGLACGLLLCHVHGHYEHHRDGTVSHHGRLYNLLFFNDGFHVEHHRRPSAHWSRLPGLRRDGAPTSRFPPILRWLETPLLERLERLAMACPPLARFVLRRHRAALGALLAGARPGRVGIVGGGLFPRTALILRQLFPAARLTIVDGNAANLEIARGVLGDEVEYRCAWYDPRREAHDRPRERHDDDFDLVVIPLSFRGARSALYRRTPARVVVVHDWIWRPRGRSRVVSLLLLKRINVVTRCEP